MLNIKDLVESYGISLEKRGKLYVGLCPFHNDKHNPNLFIYEDTNSFCCYRCKKAGDPLKFIAEIEHVSRYEIEKRLSLDILKHKMGLVKLTEKDSQINFKSETVHFAAKEFYNFLVLNPRRLEYAMMVMKAFDAKVNSVEIVDYSASGDLLEKLRKVLYNIDRGKDNAYSD